MKQRDFLDKLTLAANSKTLWVKGGFGAPANDRNKERYSNNYEYNKKIADVIMACTPDTFFFDCSGLVKGVIWGWCADQDKVYGGAVYKSNGLDDITPESLIKACPDATEDFSRIQPGELLWQEGHVGVYLGDGVAIESTGLWDDGVQFVPLSKRTGKYEWKKHGHLPWIEYEPEVVQKFQVGQLVDFTGSIFYGSATSSSPWLTDPGVAVVTEFVPGGKHQYKIKGQSGTSVNGYVDEDTLSVHETLNYTESTTSCSPSLPVLMVGNKGAGVKTLKLLLNAHGASLKVNDKFDKATGEAVKSYQQAANIKDKPLGMVGKETWRSLIRG